MRLLTLSITARAEQSPSSASAEIDDLLTTRRLLSIFTQTHDSVTIFFHFGSEIIIDVCRDL
jgi:hypothetical protein